MEIRRVKDNEFDQAIQLADKTFRREDNKSMGEAFPQVFSNDLQLSYGAFDGDKLVSFFGLVPAKIRIGDAVLNVFSIGAVCTNNDYRNGGIASDILSEIYRYIDRAQASLLFISGGRGLYRRNHCYHFGKIYHYTFDALRDNKYEGQVRKGANHDIFQIDEIRRKKKVRFESSIWEWSKLLKSAGFASTRKMTQALYVAESSDGVEGYAVIGIPAENNSKKYSLVTEWGGSTSAVLGIFSNLLENAIVPGIDFSIPWHEEIVEEMPIEPYKVTKSSGTLHITDSARLLEQLKPYFKSKGVNGLNVRQDNDGNAVVDYEEKEVILSQEELVAFLFDVERDIELDTDLNKKMPVPLPHTDGMYYV